MELILDPLLLLLDKLLPRAWMKQQLQALGCGPRASSCLVSLSLVMIFTWVIGACWATLWSLGLWGK